MQNKFQFAILAESHDRMRGLSDTASIEWLRCKQTGDGLFDFYKSDAIVSSVDLETGYFDLPYLLGILAIDAADAIEAIKKRWDSKLPTIGVAFRGLQEWDTEAILRAAMECIADNLVLHRSHSGHASLELAAYRREFDRLQRSFARLEEYVSRRSYPRAAEIFEYPPYSDMAAKHSRQKQFDAVFGAAGRTLTQFLPVDSFGVSSFSIYIGTKPENEGEPLRVQLQAIETGSIFASWSIPAAGLSAGWVELALNHAIDEPALSLAAVIEFPAERGGWTLALGPPHPYKEFCACTGPGEHLRAPIALRVFSNLPGVRVAPTAGAIRPIDAPHVQTELAPIEAYEAAVQVMPPLRDNKPALVMYDREIGCLTVHPHIGGPTVARMNVAVPKHAWGISAQISLAHEQANLTEFGLLVCAPRDESSSLARLSHLDAPSPSFSGWRALSALETKSISVVLAAPSDVGLSVYLVTRQAPGLSPDFAWARFSKFEFNVLPVSLIGGIGTDALSPVAAGSAHGGEERSIEPGSK